jgi:predicted DNA-binding transcriptional regulator AlpA
MSLRITEFHTASESLEAATLALGIPIGTPAHSALARKVRAVWLKNRAESAGNRKRAAQFDPIIWDREQPEPTQPAPQAPQLRLVGSPPLLLTLAETAALLGISPKSVKRWTGQRRFPKPVKLGRLNRWTEAAVRAWVANGGTCTKLRKAA